MKSVANNRFKKEPATGWHNGLPLPAMAE